MICKLIYTNCLWNIYALFRCTFYIAIYNPKTMFWVRVQTKCGDISSWTVHLTEESFWISEKSLEAICVVEAHKGERVCISFMAKIKMVNENELEIITDWTSPILRSALKLFPLFLLELQSDVMHSNFHATWTESLGRHEAYQWSSIIKSFLIHQTSY
jgi:hypothetical protein